MNCPKCCYSMADDDWCPFCARAHALEGAEADRDEAIRERDAALARIANLEKEWRLALGREDVLRGDVAELERELASRAGSENALRERLSAAWNDGREAAARFVEGGRFLHDKAPDAIWARAVTKGIRALVKS